MKNKNLKSFFGSKTFSLLIVIVILLAIFTIWSKGVMLKPINIRNILNNMVLLSFIGTGACFLMLYGEMDLSAGAIGSFAGCIVAVCLMKFGLPAPIAYICALIGGMTAGFVNAFMINVLNFQPFIATMCMSSVLQGVGYMLVTSGGITIQKVPLVNWLGGTKLFGGLLPVTVIIALICLVVYGIILSKTRFGRTIYLCGGNRLAAKLSGLNPKRLSYILYMNSGLLAAIGGCLYISRVKTAYATALVGYQFTGVTAAILGGIAFGGGYGNMLGCSLGILIIAIFNNGVATVGFNYNYTTIFNGVILIFGLALDAINARRKARNTVRLSLQSGAAGTGNQRRLLWKR